MPTEMTPLPSKSFRGFELPTLFLAVCIYFSWLLITYYHHHIPLLTLPIIGGYLIALHGSLQHEVVHDHPTPSRGMNTLLASVPLGLVLPFQIYRASHLAHHSCRRLTDPVEDPESYFCKASDWSNYPAIWQRLLVWNTTIAGRLIIGPILETGKVIFHSLKKIFSADFSEAPIWTVHILSSMIVISWLAYCEMPITIYLLCFVWPGLSLTLLRSFLEHRPAKQYKHQSVIINGSWLTRLLYLNNCYHALHHAYPQIPWYQLSKLYRADPKRWRQGNGNYYFDDYSQVIRRHCIHPHHHPKHPGFDLP